MQPFPITPERFGWLWLGSLVTGFGAAALLRRAQGLPFFRPKFADVEVEQHWRSAASSLALMGRLARASNCVWFALTRDTLHVGPHFPFNLFMPRFFTGLDLAISVAAISSVSKKTAALGGDYVRVEYEVRDETRGTVRTEYVDLWPMRGDHFIDVLQEKARLARVRP
jgi:hypothetical protein